jgi:hypothetical protein
MCRKAVGFFVASTKLYLNKSRVEQRRIRKSSDLCETCLEIRNVGGANLLRKVLIHKHLIPFEALEREFS